MRGCFFQILKKPLAASAVAKIDPAQTSAVLHVLITALNSDDAPLQGAVTDELGVLGKHAEPALPAPFGLLTDGCAAVKATAAEAVWRITGDRGPAKRVREVILRSEDRLYRRVGEGLVERLEGRKTAF